MPPKAGGGGAGPRRRDLSLDNTLRRTTAGLDGPRVVGNPLAVNMNQSKFSIAPLLLEGVKVNKLQLNDTICTRSLISKRSRYKNLQIKSQIYAQFGGNDFGDALL